MDTTLFKNDMFGEIRNVMEGATPWFVANDVAKALGYKDPVHTVRNIVWEENKGVAEISTPGGKQKVTIINEAGVYQLIFRSKLDSAKQFQKWVFEEVLPSIRKNGFYVNDNLTPNQVARLQQTATNYSALLKDNEGLKKQVEMLDKLNDRLVEKLVEVVAKRRNK